MDHSKVKNKTEEKRGRNILAFQYFLLYYSRFPLVKQTNDEFGLLPLILHSTLSLQCCDIGNFLKIGISLP